MIRSFSPTRAPALALLLIAAACDKEIPADAYGNLEADEVVVSSQSGGQILRLVADEGMQLDSGVVVAVIDSVPLVLDRDQLTEQKRVIAARQREIVQQLNVIDVQADIAARTLARTRRLFDAKAATAAQMDQAERETRVLQAQREQAIAARNSLSVEASVIDRRVAQQRDRINRATVVNPKRGTVLVTYAHTGEMIQQGQPLYRIAGLDTLILRAYVTGSQLAQFRLGQQVQVSVDGESGLRTIPGTVQWISDKAEFTPTPVQTRDDRATLVYAIKVAVPNVEGALKIGMPGDVTLPPGNTAQVP